MRITRYTQNFRITQDLAFAMLKGTNKTNEDAATNNFECEVDFNSDLIEHVNSFFSCRKYEKLETKEKTADESTTQPHFQEKTVQN